jgi:uncharacterized membrane protein YjfL (UPF0719 family)
VSGDEVLVTIASTALAAIGWVVWYVRLDGAADIKRPNQVTSLALSLLLAAGLEVFVVTRWSADDVRGNVAYLFMYSVLGVAWLRITELGFAFLGVSARDDVAERGNAAARYALGGALLGFACCYAGGNVGNGPGWWVVVFSSGLASAALFLVWRLADACSDTSDMVTIDRDEAAGIRLGGLLVACGAIFGRAAAGDWHSAAATTIDFGRSAWPALGVLALAVVLDTALRPTVDRPRPPALAFGVGPALISLALAAAWIVSLGWPS